MESVNKICDILNASDVDKSNILTTAKLMKANPNKFYLINSNWNTDLCYIIDDLSKAIGNKDALTRIRIAYDMNFELATTLKMGNNSDSDEKEVKSFAELLDLLEFDENLALTRENYHVIVNDDELKANDGSDDASQLVARLFQQMIFLNLNIDIVKKSEIAKSLIKDRFRSNYKKLREELDEQVKYLSSAVEYGNLSENGKSRIEDMLDAVKITVAELQKAKKRPIRIAAMGTKKAGKSVVINSLLKRDYAPTSSELPTPNTIKYIPASPNDPLTLEYNGKKLTFQSAKALSDYIGAQFEAAQKITGAGAGLGDMTIYYPSDDLNGYEVWDTPGPNVAFTEEHRKNAEECIKQVDVCIFVMNYSNHLTNDEVNFLEQIRDVFKENKKFYSLFITVNRIDERYAAEVEKSVNRVLDYIGGRLNKMEFKNLVIFGTSALQSFYLDKVKKLAAEDNLDIDELLSDSATWRAFKRAHPEDMTSIKFVEYASGNLFDFHGIDTSTEKELEMYSGIPQLWRYVKYIGSQKADMEIVNSVIARSEMQFSIIKNALNVTEYQNLSEDAKQYLEKVRPYAESLDKKAQNFSNDMDNWIGTKARDEAQSRAEADISSNETEVLKNAQDRIKTFINSMDITSDDIKEIASGKNEDFQQEMEYNVRAITDGIANQSAENMRFLIRGISEERLDKLIEGLDKHIGSMTEEVETVNELLQKSGVPEITLPVFPVNVALPTPDTTFMSNIPELKSLANASVHEVERGGLFGWILDIFSTKTEGNVQEFKNSLKSIMIKSSQRAVERTFVELSEDVHNNINVIFDDFQKSCDEVSGDYQKIFKNTLNDINDALSETNERKAMLENNIKALTDIKSHMQSFFDTWNSIRNVEEAK